MGKKKSKSYYFKPYGGSKTDMLEAIIDKLDKVNELIKEVYDDTPSNSIHGDVEGIYEMTQAIKDILLGDDDPCSGSLLRSINGLCDAAADMYTVGDISNTVDKLVKDVARVECKLDLIMAALEVEYVEPTPPEEPPKEVVLSYAGPGSGVTGSEEETNGR